MLLVLPLISRDDTASSDEVAFELVPPNHLDALANFASLHPILPFSLPSSLLSCQRVATLAWLAHRNAHQQPQLPIRVVETQGTTARKRKRADQGDVLIISSDSPVISSTSTLQGNTGAGGKKRRNPWSESVKLVLSQFMEGEDLNLETEGLEDMLVRLLK